MRPIICFFVAFLRTISATLLFVMLAIASFHVAAADSDGGPSPLVQMLHNVNSGDRKAAMMVMHSGMVTDPMLIHTCAQKGFDVAAQLLLENGAKADQQYERYGTPLHTATSSGQLRMTELLLEHGSPINEANADGFQPLHLAAQNGHTSVVKFLLKKGAKPNDAPGSATPSALLLAARNNHVAVVKALLKKGAAVDAPWKMDGRTALHAAVLEGCEEAARALLKAGAALHVQDGRGFTAFHVAAAGLQAGEGERAGEHGLALRGAANATSMLQLLLAHGADVDALSGDAMSALHIAAEANNAAGISALVGAGAAVEKRNGKGYTALHRAIFLGKLDAARALLDDGQADVNTRSHKELAPMHEAANEGMLAEIELLLSRGADAEIRDSNGATPLLHAAREGWAEAVAALLKGGAECLGKDDSGATALHMAASEGHVKVLSMLLGACGERGDRGVDVRTAAGHTALHAAVFEAQAEAVRELLAHGADSTLRTKGGRSAMDIALQQQKTRAAEHNAAADAADPRRKEPEDVVVELLLGHQHRKEGPDPASDIEGTAACASESRHAELSAESDGPWPWKAARVEAFVGHVNVSINIQASQAIETYQLPLYPLPVFDLPSSSSSSSSASPPSSSLAAASSSSSSSSALLLTSPHIHAAALHTGSLLAQGARRTLREVKRLRRALSWQQGVSSRRFWSTHWPMTTLITAVQQAVSGLSVQDRTPPPRNTRAPVILGGRDEGKTSGAKQAKLLQTLQTTFETYVDEVRQHIAPMLGCSKQELHCPDFGVYYRIDPDQYLSYVHLDFPSDAEARFNRQHGLTRDNWWNVWVLLSEKTFGGPLALLDPAQVGAKRPGFVEPNERVREGRGGWDAFTYADMQQGDAIVWRTTKVPHAGARLVRSEPGRWEESAAAVQQRESLDVRCACVPA